MPDLPAAPPPGEPDGAALIAAERRRQIEAEGWTPEHDREHSNGELVRAAATYALYDMSDVGALHSPGEIWPTFWKFKPSTDRVRNLVKAGALIAAEIDRLSAAAGAAGRGAADGDGA